jgi:hypothetical protein
MDEERPGPLCGTTEVPPAPMRTRAAGRMGAAEDLKTLRLRRATAKAPGGVLGLVMPMRVGGEGRPLSCAPPMVDLSWCYLAPLPHIDARYPLYGLQVRGLRRPEPLPTSMEEMARAARARRAPDVQPGRF